MQEKCFQSYNKTARGCNSVWGFDFIDSSFHTLSESLLEKLLTVTVIASLYDCSKILRRNFTNGNLHPTGLVCDASGSHFHKVVVEIQKQTALTILQLKSLVSNVK